MAAPVIDISRPNSSNVYNVDLDAIRENVIWLMIAAAASHYALPGWDSVATPAGGTDYNQPTDIVLTNKANTNIKMKFAFFYTGSNLTTETWWFDRDSGGSNYEQLGTLTHQYTPDGNGWTGALSS